MTTSTLIGKFEREWETLAHTSKSALAYRALAEREPSIAVLGALDLGGVVAKVRRAPGSLPGNQAARVLSAMLRSGSVDPLVVRAVFQCLCRGVVRPVRTLGALVHAWPDPGECWDDAVVTLWTVVQEWAGQDRPYAALDVLSAVRCRLRRQALAVLAEARRTCELDAETVPSPPEQTDLEALALALDAPSELGLGSADAAIIAMTRVHGYSLDEVAVITGRSRGHVQYRRERAEAWVIRRSA